MNTQEQEPTIRIMLADDHAIVRSGLRRLLEQREGMEVVAEAESGEQAYRLFGEHLPDVAVLDLSMPGMGGIEALRRIRARYQAARLLIFSMHENVAFANQVLKAGARGYVVKTGSPEELVTAVQEVAQGKVYISSGMANKMAMYNLNGEDPFAHLNAREFEIFRLVAEGASQEEIGDKLKISQKTVANNLTVIKQKLGVTNSIEMLRLAIRHGIAQG